MYKLLTAAAFTGFLSSAASAAVFDAFSVDSADAAGTESSVILEAGRTYEITVSGTVTLGVDPSRHVADAEFFNLGSNPLVPLDFVGSQEIGIGVDGSDLDFGSFDPSNVYTATVVGDGSTINVFFQDSNYGDNSGSFSVEIAVVPLPAALLLMFTGIAGLGFTRRR